MIPKKTEPAILDASLLYVPKIKRERIIFKLFFVPNIYYYLYRLITFANITPRHDVISYYSSVIFT